MWAACMKMRRAECRLPGVSVTPEATYEIKRVDSDYFNEA